MKNVRVTNILTVFDTFQATLAFNFSSWTEPEYNGPFPLWGQAIGWMIMLSSLIVIPVDWIYFVITAEGSFKEVIYMIKSDNRTAASDVRDKAQLLNSYFYSFFSPQNPVMVLN